MSILIGWGRGGVVLRLFASRLGEPSYFPGGVASAISHVGIVSDDAAGRRVFSGGLRLSPALAFRRCFVLTAHRPLQISSLTSLIHYLLQRNETSGVPCWRQVSLMTQSALCDRRRGTAQVAKVRGRSRLSGSSLCGRTSNLQHIFGRVITPKPREPMTVKRGENGAGKTGDPRENRPASGIVRHDSRMQKSGSDPVGYRTRVALVRGEWHGLITAPPRTPSFSGARVEGRGKREIPEINPSTNGIVLHDSNLRKSGVTRPGIEPESTWWKASVLTAQPSWPPLILNNRLGSTSTHHLEAAVAVAPGVGARGTGVITRHEAHGHEVVCGRQHHEGTPRVPGPGAEVEQRGAALRRLQVEPRQRARIPRAHALLRHCNNPHTHTHTHVALVTCLLPGKAHSHCQTTKRQLIGFLGQLRHQKLYNIWQHFVRGLSVDPRRDEAIKMQLSVPLVAFRLNTQPPATVSFSIKWSECAARRHALLSNYVTEQPAGASTWSQPQKRAQCCTQSAHAEWGREKLSVLRPLTRERPGTHYTSAVTSTALLHRSLNRCALHYRLKAYLGRATLVAGQLEKSHERAYVFEFHPDLQNNANFACPYSSQFSGRCRNYRLFTNTLAEMQSGTGETHDRVGSRTVGRPRQQLSMSIEQRLLARTPDVAPHTGLHETTRRTASETSAKSMELYGRRRSAHVQRCRLYAQSCRLACCVPVVSLELRDFQWRPCHSTGRDALAKVRCSPLSQFRMNPVPVPSGKKETRPPVLRQHGLSQSWTRRVTVRKVRAVVQRYGCVNGWIHADRE
ncbi:hypothetical protein PR048_020448 [Dryococelus australis]|uniref:Uncharacterized protein n=1 Tax=Dryococelus australis TaxID=614101 RepID=A0ABQ9H6I4_9NEOP|nr:hypothetical protein PR048_020448 [Dryococelus australis]